MYEFDVYINSIVNNLNLSKKQKDEMFEEFLDHLEMLKQEFISEGFSEKEAVTKAIEQFGNNIEITKKINKVSLCYRKVPNIILGIIFYLTIYRIGSFIAVAGAENNFLSFILGTTSAILVFSPIGYFTPILFDKVGKIRNLIFISFITGVLICLYTTVKVLMPINQLLTIAICLVGSIIGSILGFGLLNISHKVTLFCENVYVHNKGI